MAQKTFSIEALKNSEEYKKWIGGEKVVKIHDTYHDDPIDYAAYIVITSRGGSYTITRFFPLFGADIVKGIEGRIQASVDHQNISAEQVFDLLLKDYSRGLK